MDTETLQPEMRDLQDPHLKWGSTANVVFAANDQRRVRLVDVRLWPPQTVTVVCLPDPTGLPVRYWVRYGSGGSMRESAALAPGTYVCGGDQVFVDATYIQAPGTAVASAAASVGSCPHTVP